MAAGRELEYLGKAGLGAKSCDGKVCPGAASCMLFGEPAVMDLRDGGLGGWLS